VPFLIKDLFTTTQGSRSATATSRSKRPHRHLISDADRHCQPPPSRPARDRQAARTATRLGTCQPRAVAWGATAHHGPTLTPGGSSGGVGRRGRVGMVPFAHASDGGGSIRIPRHVDGPGRAQAEPGSIRLGPGPRTRAACLSSTASAAPFATKRPHADATRAPHRQHRVSRPPAPRPYFDELGADPGRCASASDHHPQGGRSRGSHPCLRRPLSVALESLGHHRGGVAEGIVRTVVGVQVRVFVERQHGIRSAASKNSSPPLAESRVRADDLIQATSRNTSPPSTTCSHCHRPPQIAPPSLQSWWHDGWICCSRRRSASMLSTSARSSRPRSVDVADASCRGEFVAVHLSRSTKPGGQPAISLPLEFTAVACLSRTASLRLRSRRRPAPLASQREQQTPGPPPPEI